jgi:hypothetical protein
MVSRLHIFIDGTWLFRACAPDQILSAKTEYPGNRFEMDFSKLSRALLTHVQSHDLGCNGLGDLFFATSIFRLPDNFAHWPAEHEGIRIEDIERTRRNVAARRAFADRSLAAGFSRDAIYEPPIKGYIVRKLRKGEYQEKQVDTAVVALVVRSAILYGRDFHAVITGDADLLPAITVAYPEYSRNIFIATTHPDELRAEHRQTAWSLNDFAFEIEPYYLQDHIEEIVAGEHVYTCSNCRRVFVRRDPIPTRARPYCKPCFETRT